MSLSPSTHALGEQLRALRVKADLRQSHLAKHLQVSPKTIQNWEAGRTIPTPHHMKAFMAFALHHHLVERADLPLLVAQFPALYPSVEEILEEIPFTDHQPRPRPTWGEAIDVHAFCGRERERERLSQWIIQDRCRVISVIGMAGIGKTWLVMQVAQQLGPQFERVIRWSLHDPRPVQALLHTCVMVLDARVSIPAEADACVQTLMTLMQDHRLLLVLENVDVLLTAQPAGEFLPAWQAYGVLIEQAARLVHQSCLVLTSRESIMALRAVTGMQTPIRLLCLEGMDLKAARQVLEEKALTGSPEGWQQLLDAYGGNPQFLRLVSADIRELYAGTISQFLEVQQDHLLTRQLRTVLDAQWSRLNAMERAVLFWLALELEPLALSALKASMRLSPDPSLVVEAVRTLSQRCWLVQHEEQTTTMFSLSQVLQEYARDHVLELMTREVLMQAPQELLRYALLSSKVHEDRRARQWRVQVQALLARVMQATGWQKTEVIFTCQHLLKVMRALPSDRQGYGAGNVLNLLIASGADLSGLDLSHLLIERADVQTVPLRRVDLSGAHVHDVTFLTQEGGIRALCVMPNGIIAVGRSNGILDLRTRERLVFSIPAHTSGIWSLAAWSEHAIISSGYDGRVNLWDTQTGEHLWSFEGHRRWVRGIAVISPREHPQILTAGYDGTIRGWEPGKGALGVVHQQDTAILSLTATAELVAWGDAAGQLSLASSKRLHEPQTIAAHTGSVNCLAFHPTRPWLVSGSSDGTLALWETRQGLLLGRQQFERHVTSVSWNPDGTLLVSGDQGGTLRLLDARTPDLVLRQEEHLKNSVLWSTRMSDDGTLFVGTHQGVLQVWEPGSPQGYRRQFSVPSLSRRIRALACNPTATELAAGDEMGALLLWQRASAQVQHIPQAHSGHILALAWHPEHPLIASSGDDQLVKVWDTSTGTLRLSLPPLREVAWSVSFHPRGHVLAVGVGGVSLYETASGRLLHHLPHAAWVWALAWSPDGRTLASGDRAGVIQLWGETGQALHTLQTGVEVLSLAWSPDGKEVISLSNQDVARWNIETDTRTQHRSRAPHTANWLNTAVVNAQGGQVWASIGEDRSVRVSEIQETPQQIEGTTGRMEVVALSADGTLVAGGDEQGTLAVWDRHSGRLLQQVQQERVYEGMRIKGIQGITPADRNALLALGATER